MKFSLSKIFMVIMAGLMPLPSLHAMQQPRIIGSLGETAPSVAPKGIHIHSTPSPSVPQVVTPTGIHSRGRFSFRLPSLPSLPKLPSLHLPSRNTAAYALFGGTLLVVAAVALYKKWSKSDVHRLNEILVLLNNELNKFFNALNIYESEEYAKLYKFISPEYRYLKQYNIEGFSATSTTIPNLPTAVAIIMKQNPNLQTIRNRIKELDPKLLSTADQTQLINEIESIAYQISIFFNLYVKETRPWYRQLATPAVNPLTEKEKGNLLLPIARSITAINNLIYEKNQTIRGEKIQIPPSMQGIFIKAQGLLQNIQMKRAISAELDAFIKAVAPAKADL